MKIAITGFNGFIGKRLSALLLDQGHELILIGRRAPKYRLGSDPLATFVECDLAKDEEVESLLESPVKDAQALVHLAALYNLEASFADCYMGNIKTTENILKIAKSISSLKYFHHISTVAVAGNYAGEFSEDLLDRGQRFHDNYAQTKMQSERLVRDSEMSASKRIYRLGIVVGDSRKGKFDQENGPYYFLRVLGNLNKFGVPVGLLPIVPLPFAKNSTFPLVTVDDVASSLKHMIEVPTTHDMRTYHVISPDAPTMQNFIQDALGAFGYKGKAIGFPASRANAFIFKALGVPAELSSYIYTKCSFTNKNLKEDFPELEIHQYAKFKKALFTEAMRRFS